MKPLTYADLITTLQNEYPDFQPPPTPPTEEARTPWYLRLMLGIIGLLGGCFILGFFGAVLSNLYRNTPSQLILSTLLFALASAIYRRWQHSDLADQFALVMSIAGQILIAIAFGDLWQNEPALGSLLLALLQIGLIILMPNTLHRLLSTFVALLALGYTADRLHLPANSAVSLIAVAGFIGLTRTQAHWVVAGKRALLEPVMLALGCALLLVSLQTLSPLHTHAYVNTSLKWLPPSAILGAGLWVTAWRLSLRLDKPARLLALGGTGLLIIASWLAPGIIASTLVALLAYRYGYRPLLGLALIGTVWYLGSFYYQLQQTLLVKAGSLLAVGVVLLLGRALMRHTQEETP